MSRCLGDDAEVGVGKPAGLDTLEEPPEWGGVRNVGGLNQTSTAGKYATDPATDVGDNRA